MFVCTGEGVGGRRKGRSGDGELALILLSVSGAWKSVRGKKLHGWNTGR